MSLTTTIIMIGAGGGLAGLLYWRRFEAIAEPGDARDLPLEFNYYPGEPEGYSAFTDRHAMLQAITDDIVHREADWQFRTLGFANGFLRRLSAIASEKADLQATIRVMEAREKDEAAVRWLARMQIEGAENASPSTSNLMSAVQKIAAEIAADGPCRSKYWSEVPKQTMSNPALLAKFVRHMQIEERRGSRLADCTKIIHFRHEHHLDVE